MFEINSNTLNQIDLQILKNIQSICLVLDHSMLISAMLWRHFSSAQNLHNIKKQHILKILQFRVAIMASWHHVCMASCLHHFGLPCKKLTLYLPSSAQVMGSLLHSSSCPLLLLLGQVMQLCWMGPYLVQPFELLCNGHHSAGKPL